MSLYSLFNIGIMLLLLFYILRVAYFCYQNIKEKDKRSLLVNIIFIVILMGGVYLIIHYI